MLPEEYKQYFRLLEVDENASLPEVTRAYLHLKDLYSHTSTETIPVEQEFLAGSRQDILQQLKTAYSTIKELYAEAPPPGQSKASAARIVLPETRFSGPLLRQLRKEAGLSLSDIAQQTKVSQPVLHSLEFEDFSALPPAVYIRGYLIRYAECLMLDGTAVADSYLDRYRVWQASQ